MQYCLFPLHQDSTFKAWLEVTTRGWQLEICCMVSNNETRGELARCHSHAGVAPTGDESLDRKRVMANGASGLFS